MPLLSWLWGRALELPFLWTKYINVTVHVNVLSTSITNKEEPVKFIRASPSKLLDRSSPISPIVLRKSAIDDSESSSFSDTQKGECSWKPLLSSPTTASDTFTAGIAVCPPRTGSLALHRHAHAELYHILSGQGIICIDGTDHVVGEGDVVFIPGDTEHGVFNTNETLPFKWFYRFAADRFEDVIYRFKHESGKSAHISY